ADDQADEPVGQSEYEGAAAGEEQQRALNGLGTVPVEQGTKGELNRGKHQEVDGGQKSEVLCVDVEFGHEIAGNQRIDAAEEVGEIIAGSKGQEHAGDETRLRHGLHRKWGCDRWVGGPFGQRTTEFTTSPSDGAAKQGAPYHPLQP